MLNPRFSRRRKLQETDRVIADAIHVGQKWTKFIVSVHDDVGIL